MVTQSIKPKVLSAEVIFTNKAWILVSRAVTTSTTTQAQYFLKWPSLASLQISA